MTDSATIPTVSPAADAPANGAVSPPAFPVDLPPGLDAVPPTQDELPYEDDWMPESNLHEMNPELLRLTLERRLAGIRDAFIAINMFVYFADDQVRAHDFRGPDFFVVLDVPQTPHKSWVVWWEGGRGPDVVVEFLSGSTAREGKTTKLAVYRDRLRVPEYFWFDPWSGELGGVRLVANVYQPIQPEADGSLHCESLGLNLVVWEGAYLGLPSCWLRWATPDGALLPTPQEAEQESRARADEERVRADEERARAEAERARAEAAEREVERLRRLLEGRS